ncbi:MAG: hypothetical protein ACYC21_10755 [Eubacteriales bacterium]
MSTLEDATVNGSIKTIGVSATINASVSCVNNRPTGTLNGTAVVRKVFRRETITFSSTTAIAVRTVKRFFTQSVEAQFGNVTVRNLTTGRTFTGCTAFLTATRVSPTVFFASINIVCRGVLVFRLFGFFTGSLIVNREAACRLLT